MRSVAYRSCSRVDPRASPAKFVLVSTAFTLLVWAHLLGPRPACAQDASAQDAAPAPEQGALDTADGGSPASPSLDGPQPPLASDAAAQDGGALPPASPTADSSVPVIPPSGPAPEPASEPALAIAAPITTASPAGAEPVEVTVVGTRLSRTAGSAHVLRSRDLERFNYDDPHRVLLSVPGVYIRGEDGMGLRPNIGIRGVNPDRSKKVTLLEDGVLVGPAPYSAPAAYYFPIMTRIDKVRVFKGPGTISYGPQTVGGTIDLVTRDIPARTSGAADVAVGQYGYGKAHVYAGSSTEQVGFLIEGVRLQNNGFKELPSGADTGFVRNEWMVKGSYLIDPRARVKNELKLKLTYSDEVSNESYLGLTDADFERNPDRRYPASALDRMTNHRTSVVLTHRLETPKRLSLVTNVYRHDFHRVWRKVNGIRGTNLVDVLNFPNEGNNRGYYDVLSGKADSSSPDRLDAILIGPNQRDFVSSGAETRLSWEAETGPVSHRLEVGARYHYDSIERRHSENGFLVEGGELVPDGLPTEVTAFNKAYTHAGALHMLYAATWSGLTITPGVRGELMRSGADEYIDGGKDRRTARVLLPAIGAFYAILPELGILAGVYQGFSPPPPGSPKAVKSEKSLNYEAGVRYTRGLLRLESIGFYNDYDNLTSVCTFSGSCSQSMEGMQRDLGRARIYGVEVSGQHDLPLGPVKLPLLLSYTHTQTEFLHSFTSDDPSYANVSVGDEVPYVPQHQLRVSAGVEHARAGGNASLTYVSATREEAGDTPMSESLHMDEQVVVDLAAYATLWKTISLYGSVQNLFDSRYVASHRPFGARPNAPRWVQVGLKGSF
jgi:Fe(3+) dicitrate transport protein